MTFGRPATIPDDYVKLDLPQPLDGDADLIVNSVCFFNGTMYVLLFSPLLGAIFNIFVFRTLYRIMWSIITLFYDGNVGCQNQITVLDAVSHLFKVEQQLVDWERNLPSNIRLRRRQDVPAAHDSEPTEKFNIVLTLRHHNLRILLHRPMIVRFLDIIGGEDFNNPEVAVLQQIGPNSIQICVQTSMDIVSIVSAIIKPGVVRSGMLGAWWFTLYYSIVSFPFPSLSTTHCRDLCAHFSILVFNAALVLCASLLMYQNPTISISSPNIPLGSIRASIDEAAQTLQYLDIENPTINTCAKYLRRLASVLDLFSK